MKAKRSVNFTVALEEAKAGQLQGLELRKLILAAEELGKANIATQLGLYLVHSGSFAGDAAPAVVRERVAKGISALTGMGEPLSRTKQMLKRHGVIETLNRIACHPDASENFAKLRAAGLEHLTAEAIVLDFPDLFDPKTVEVARERLQKDGSPV
jgi:hypothetical protein